MAIRSRLHFTPQNLFTTVPSSENRLVDPPVAPISTTWTPIYALAFAPDQPGPVIGADVETAFDPVAVGQRAHVVSVRMDGHEQTRLSIDFSKLD